MRLYAGVKNTVRTISILLVTLWTLLASDCDRHGWGHLLKVSIARFVPGVLLVSMGEFITPKKSGGVSSEPRSLERDAI